MTQTIKYLSWDEVATIYDKQHTGRPARTLPMETVYNWATKQKNIVVHHDKEGQLSLKKR